MAINGTFDTVKENGKTYYLMFCQCGRKKKVRKDRIKESTHCKYCNKGLFKKTHGLKKTPEYNVWGKMKARCLNPKNNQYHNYGGRGIKVCDRWLNDFSNFIKDMGFKPTSIHQIDRIDNDGDYTPDNCKWSTPKENMRNTRVNHYIEYNGERLTLTDMAIKYNMNIGTLWERIIIQKLDPHAAITKSVRKIKKHSRLNMHKARQIRGLYYASRHTYESLGVIFDVGKDSIYKVIKNMTWKENKNAY